MKKQVVLLLFLLGFFFISCETEVPEVDDTPPTFSFRVTGDGFDRTFTQDDDFANLQLNLRHDADYDIIYSGADQGGVRNITLRYTTDYIEFDDNPPFPAAPWTQDFSGLSAFVEWEGDRSNPLTGSILTGTFRPNGENVSTSFSFSVTDFGGENNDANTTTGELNILIGDFNTELINLSN